MCSSQERRNFLQRAIHHRTPRPANVMHINMQAHFEANGIPLDYNNMVCSPERRYDLSNDSYAQFYPSVSHNIPHKPTITQLLNTCINQT
ncbi:hypothetical protein BVRB_2g036870 [Beta vulgaris subsp. vulgaris]|uniref:Uncharacterized protein n=1 Tax=Beta vulgaris subsp. vulgaris TaxID=3555 RepID=A0A0J8CZR1_BETVV|nr:hypothetical protein BVRB_2g036870 [Beta vulgaris subsp. vulgaris]